MSVMRNKDVLVAGETIWERIRDKSQGINVRLEMGQRLKLLGAEIVGGVSLAVGKVEVIENKLGPELGLGE